MAASSDYAGTVGKFRKRPSTRASAKPYDRPSPAARGLRVVSPAARSNGWLSKLVDPASRFISGSASKIFSSFISKRLTGPVVVAEENHQIRQEIPEAACTNPLSGLLDGQDNGGDDPVNNSDTAGISGLEQLLNQKTFTKIEFDHLTELLRSRTVEPLAIEPAAHIKEIEKETGPSEEKRTSDSRLYEHFSSPSGNLTIPKDEDALPEDLAKAYMGSRPFKMFPSGRPPVFQEVVDLPSIRYVPKPSNMSVAQLASRSIARASGSNEIPENGYWTPKSRGRSAMYRMSCSPYFKGGRPTEENYTAPSSSQLKPRNTMHSSGKQGLKRVSSVLDSNFGSGGPMRRIRHKSYLGTPSMDSHSTPLNRDFMEGSASVHTPYGLDAPKFYGRVKNSENKENKISYGGVAHVPQKSSETAMKILQQLDKLVPSPKEKTSEPKVLRDDSPSMSKHDMLGGQAGRSMEDITSSVQASLSKKKNRVEESGPSKPAVSGANLTFADSDAILSADMNSDATATNLGAATSAALRPRERPPGQMTPSEVLFVSGDRYNRRGTSGQSSMETGKHVPNISKNKTAVSEADISLKDPTSSSKSLPSSNSIFSKEADVKNFTSPVAQNNTGFMAPVEPAPSAHFQSPQTPTMATPSLDRSDPKKDQMSAPLFSFGAKAAAQEVGASTTSTTTATYISNSDKGGEIQKGADSSKSLGIPVSSGTTMSSASIFGFSASTTTGQINGSLSLPSLVFPVSATSASQLSDTHSRSTSSTTPTTTTPVSLFQFGSSSSVAPPVSLPHPIRKTDFTSTEAKSSASQSTVVFSTTGNNSSSTLTSTAVALSSPFSASSGLTPSFMPSPAFPSTGNGIFGFSASSQPTTLSLSSATNSSQSSASVTFGLSNSSSSSFTSSPFGATITGTNPFSGPGFTFSAGFGSSSTGKTSSSFAPASYQLSSSSVFGFTSTTPSTGFAFGQSSPSMFGSASGFGSGPQGNDQMNVEDSMTDDTKVPAFGQPAAPSATPVFQFGGHQTPTIPQSPPLFQTAPSGNFSLGTGGGQKSGRRIVKRDKIRRK